MKIAMWSGPRNLSTALMYSFANRSDFSAVDEPFYAAYLHATGLDHPMRKEVLDSQDTDPVQVINTLLESSSSVHQYQKHMTQHMLSEFPLDWMSEVENVFLIRHPARVLASWANKHTELSSSDIGFEQQERLVEIVSNKGKTPIVVDSADIRSNPRAVLRALCARLDLPWDEAMLSWPAGPKPFDGVWASHWYDAVHRSTGFAGAEGPLPDLPSELQALNEKALPIYERLTALKMTF